MCFSYNKIHDQFIILSGNQSRICIQRHYLSSNVNAVWLVWRIRHYRGKQTKSVTRIDWYEASAFT